MLQLGDLDDHDPYKAALDDDQVAPVEECRALNYLVGIHIDFISVSIKY